ncbi:GAF and ANTAR domain-containing protein [Streptomyces seoulensis]|uniref:GAF and ANTAR domain-containing protein n=1 Tax=Streptomyces seoulensis TaxID=73044 RepID=UPI001FCAAD65|nr:GAF and ANTAR domain-containing protein [Streptomyces seoulensis]BDH07858.1 transcriptional regulator [Streptomyces seoulensis]
MATREQQLTEVFVEVADSLTDDFDVIDFLQKLSVRCMELLDVAAVGILLSDENGGLHVLAASDEDTRLLELLALQHDQGPCVDCCNDGRPRVNISLTDPEAAARWPQFARSARETGFTATNALPLRLRGRIIGALNLFRTSPEPLAAQDIALGQALADVATIAILQQRTLAHIEAERDQLQYALNSRIVIEQVKGILAERWQMPIDEAFGIFRAYARAHNRKLSGLARAIAEGEQDTDSIRTLPAGPTDTGA